MRTYIRQHKIGLQSPPVWLVYLQSKYYSISALVFFYLNRNRSNDCPIVETIPRRGYYADPKQTRLLLYVSLLAVEHNETQ